VARCAHIHVQVDTTACSELVSGPRPAVLLHWRPGCRNKLMHASKCLPLITFLRHYMTTDMWHEPWQLWQRSAPNKGTPSKLWAKGTKSEH